MVSHRKHEIYNGPLVNRVEDLLDPSFLMGWKLLLADNNRGKRGHPYRTSNAFITFLAKLRAVYNVPFRSLEGIARIFARITGIATVCYTSIFRRIRKIVPAIPDSQGKPVGCAIDSTGFKITIRGDYLGSKWKKPRKGWSKLHAVISINDVSAMSFTITHEHVHDAKAGKELLRSVSRGSPARARIVRQIRSTSEKEWKESVDYGKRWHVEIYFSGLKRTMGEVIKAVRPDYIVQEIALKVQYYNVLREMTHAY